MKYILYMNTYRKLFKFISDYIISNLKTLVNLRTEHTYFCFLNACDYNILVSLIRIKLYIGRGYRV